MPAKLVITSGSSAGTDLWIEEMVLRIGSESQCQICLREPGLPAHAATLQYRDGKYQVHNRTEHGIYVAGREIAKGGSAKWSPGEELRLTDMVALRLDVEGDPAPGPRPRFRPVEEPAPEEEEGEPQPVEAPRPAGAEARRLVQIVVIVLCFGGGGLALLMDSSSSSNAPARNSKAEFTSVVKELIKARPTADFDPAELRAALQSARLAQLRGDQKRSQALYAHVRDTLLARRLPDGRFALPVEANVLDFVETQLKPPSDSDPSSGS